MINKKMYYSISEVCELTGLEQHVLRYWEGEIPQLRPKKNSAGNRAYREKDIELVRKIKHLLYEEKLSVQAARQRLTEERKAEKRGKPSSARELEPQEPDAIEPPEQQAETPPEEPEQVRLDLSSQIPEEKSASTINSALRAEIRKGLEDVLALLESAIKTF